MSAIRAERRRLGKRVYYVLLIDGRVEEAYINQREFKRAARTIGRRWRRTQWSST